MFTLIYVSSAFKKLNHNELLEMLNISVKNNLERAVTGFLIYSDGNFIQALEGNESDVEFIFSKILNDKRHHDISVLDRSAIEHRNFEDWSMNFKILNDDETRRLNGYMPISKLNTLTGNGVALKLLLGFAENNRA